MARSRQERQEERPISRKVRALLMGGLFILLAPLGLLFFVSRSNLGSDALRETAQAQLEELLGARLDVGTLKGNPLRGYRTDGISIENDDGVIASGESVELHLSLRSLASGNPTISLLRLKGFSLDLSCLQGRDKGGCPELPRGLRRLELVNGRLILGDETVHIAHATAEILEGRAAVEGEGLLRGLPFTAGLRITASGEGLRLRKSSLSLGGSLFQLEGLLSPTLDLAAKALPLDLSELARLLPDLAEAGLTGKADVSFSLTGDLASPELDGTIRLHQGEAVAIALSDFRSAWSWKDRRFSLSGIAGRANGSPVEGELGLLFDGDSLGLDLALQGRAIRVESWWKAFPWLSFAAGEIDVLSADLEGPTEALAGTVRFREASATIGGEKADSLEAELLLDGNKTITVAGKGLWAAAPVDVTGSVLLDEATTLDLHFATNALALHQLRAHFGWLDPLLPEGSLAGTFSVEGPAAAPAYRGYLRSDRIRIRRTLLEKFEARFAVVDGEALIDDASGLWQGASLKATGRLAKLLNPSQTTLAVTGTVRDLSLADLPQGGLDLRGRAKGDWALDGPLDAPRLEATLTVSDVAVAGMKGGTFSVKAGYDGRTLTLSSLKGPFLGGRVEGQGKLLLDETPSLKLLGAFHDLPLAEAALGETLPPGTITSRLSGGYLLEGPLSGLRLLLNVKEGTATAWEVPVEAVEGRCSFDGEGLQIEKASLSLLGGETALEGTIRGPENLSLKAKLAKLDIAAFPERDRLAFTLGGELSGTIALSCSREERLLEADLTVPRLKLGDFSLDDVNVKAKGDDERLEIETAQGLIGTSPVEARGSFALSPLRGTFSLAGRELDLALFASGVDPQKTGGLFDITLDAQVGPENFSGTGALTSPSLRLGGLRIDGLQAPFIVQDRYLTIEDGRGLFYGGTILTQWSLGIDEERWGGNLSIKGFDLAQALADGFDLEGSLSGTTDLQVSLSGTYGRAMLLDGRGSLTVTDGQVEGFSALSKVGGPIPYRSLNVHYVIDGRTLYLLPGSRAAAPAGNGLYRYLSFDGSLTPGKSLDIAGYGELNLQAFGALLGAISKLAMAQTSQAMVQGFLSGLLGGVTGRDFREVSFSLAGDWQAPVLKDVKVQQPPARATPIPQTAADPRDRGDQKQFSFRLEFPTGEGSDKGGSEMGSQITQQILDQILLQILGVDEENPEDGSFFH